MQTGGGGDKGTIQQTTFIGKGIYFFLCMVTNISFCNEKCPLRMYVLDGSPQLT